MRTFIAALMAAMIFVAVPAAKAADTQAELDRLKREIDDIRRKLNTPAPGVRSSVDKVVDSKYGPNTSVTTKSGKLTISGLIQVWYRSIQNDNRGLFDDAAGSGMVDTNEAQDNDGFQIRRTEIKFVMDIHENVTGVIMIDPAREITSFADGRDNQGQWKRANQVAPQFNNANGPGLGSTSSVGGVQSGSGAVPRLLQDAYINFHGVLPHHDYSVGQFKPAFGEEGIRSSAQLDFCERSFVGQLGDQRDLGMQVHGTWWDDRFQYWVGLFDGAGSYYLSSGQYQNRADDNDEKDFSYRMLVRPLWKNETWGSIELGWSSEMGKHGESSGHDPIATPVNGLNRNQSWAIRHAAWFSYMPGGPVRGWWLRAEGAYIKDRNAPGTVVDQLGGGGTEIGNTGDGTGLAQSTGKPFSSVGGYIATGYKISDSIFCDSAPSWIKPFEFAFRFDTFQNVEVADPANPSHTNAYRTDIWTAGVNYYIKGHDAKIQMNYNWVGDPSGPAAARFHNVKNDNFIVNFQVAF